VNRRIISLYWKIVNQVLFKEKEEEKKRGGAKVIENIS
jgi:hypothetical protein